jgi:hypothetical protein
VNKKKITSILTFSIKSNLIFCKIERIFIMNPLPIIPICIIALLIITPQAALAYIGPGAGISAIGTVIAFIAAVFLAIVGFLWYPIKRLLAKIKKNKKGAQS